jgi:putative ABC transport system permease protein
MSWQAMMWHGLRRRPMRTSLTAASLATAFLLIGLFVPFLDAFGSRGDLSGADRLIVQPRHSITDFLPVSHAAVVDGLPGVWATTHQTWFGGTFRDPANTFPRWAVPPESFLAVRPEILLDPAERRTFLERRAAAIVGRDTAARFALAVGDRVAIVPDIWSSKDGRAWELEVAGIFDGADRTVDLTALYFDYGFFDEYRAWGSGLVSFLLVAVDGGVEAAEVAAAIDGRFANSADETATASELDYLLSFAEQLGNMRLTLSVILGSVLFTIVLVACVTTAQGARERLGEFALLQALGFPRRVLIRLLVGETLLLVLLGAVPGVAAATVLLRFGPAGLALADPGPGVAVGFLVVLSLVALAAVPPAWQLRRLRVIDGLRRA